MKIPVFVVILTFFGFSQNSFSVSSNGYNFCSKVSSGFIGCHEKDRSIVVNYEASSDYFIFLRCGTDQQKTLLDVKNETNCHVYRVGRGSDLCEHERSVSKLSSFFHSLSKKNKSINSLGSDLKSLVKINLSALKAENLDPSCLGFSLLKNIAFNKSAETAIQSYFSVHKDLASFLKMSEFKEGLSLNKNLFVFENLDKILMGDNGSRQIASVDKKSQEERIFLRGPAYMKTSRSNLTTELHVDEDDKPGFCSKFPDISNFSN